MLFFPRQALGWRRGRCGSGHGIGVRGAARIHLATKRFPT